MVVNFVLLDLLNLVCRIDDLVFEKGEVAHPQALQLILIQALKYLIR